VLFTAITAIGVLLELPDEIPQFRLGTRIGRLQWRFRSWPKRLVRIGAIAVVVGVGGEVVFEALMVIAERDARKKDNEIIARDEGIIESNKRSLSERLENTIQEAGVEKDKLDRSISESRKQVETVAQLRERAGKLEVEAEKLRAANLELEEELSPRLFKDQDKGAKILRGYPVADVILEYLVDVECRRTAEQIAFVLDLAGWKYSPIPLSNPDRYFQDAVSIGGGANWQSTSAFMEVLNETGIDAGAILPGISSRDAMLAPASAMFIRVGMKPSPDQHRIMQKQAAVEIAQNKMGPGDFETPRSLVDARNALRNALRTRVGVNGNRASLPAR
jgi:hypothetical protein